MQTSPALIALKREINPHGKRQALILSVILTYWLRHPRSKWLGIVMAVGFVLTLALLALVSR